MILMTLILYISIIMNKTDLIDAFGVSRLKKEFIDSKKKKIYNFQIFNRLNIAGFFAPFCLNSTLSGD